VKLHAIVKAFAGEFGDTRDMVRCQIRAQLDNNVAAVERKSKCLIGHIEIPFGV
jgi:hypothetical protein